MTSSTIDRPCTVYYPRRTVHEPHTRNRESGGLRSTGEHTRTRGAKGGEVVSLRPQIPPRTGRRILVRTTPPLGHLPLEDMCGDGRVDGLGR